MTRTRGTSCSLLIISAALLVLPFPAPVLHAGEKGPSLKTVRGVVRSFDTGTGVLDIATDAGKSVPLRVDDRVTLIFRGLFPAEAVDLVQGTGVEIDFRSSEGNELPVISWLEILPSPSEKGDNASNLNYSSRRGGMNN